MSINGKKPGAFEVPFFLFGGDGNRAHRAGQHVRVLLKVLPSEAFLKGIFGEKMWDILENYNRVHLFSRGFAAEYTIQPLKNNKPWNYQDPDQFEVYLKLSDKVRYSKNDTPSFGYNDGDFEEKDFNFIGLRFIFDIEANRIRDVKFRDRLIQNGECVARGATSEVVWDLK